MGRVVTMNVSTKVNHFPSNPSPFSQPSLPLPTDAPHVQHGLHLPVRGGADAEGFGDRVPGLLSQLLERLRHHFGRRELAGPAADPSFSRFESEIEGLRGG